MRKIQKPAGIILRDASNFLNFAHHQIGGDNKIRKRLYTVRDILIAFGHYACLKVSFFPTAIIISVRIRAQTKAIQIKQPAFMGSKFKIDVRAYLQKIHVLVAVNEKGLPGPHDLNVDLAPLIIKISGIAATVKMYCFWLMLPFVMIKKNGSEMAFTVVSNIGNLLRHCFAPCHRRQRGEDENNSPRTTPWAQFLFSFRSPFSFLVDAKNETSSPDQRRLASPAALESCLLHQSMPLSLCGIE